MTDIIFQPQQTTALSTELRQAAEKARAFVDASVPHNTKRGYASDWNDFTEWCRTKGVATMPAHPTTVAAYIADRSSGLKASSLRRHLSAIAKAHSVAGHPAPTRVEPVVSTMKGIERTKGNKVDAKAAADVDIVRRLLHGCNESTLTGLRNRAIVLVGFAGAFRRSELAALTTDDLKWSSDGVVITLSRSKTDQRGEGFVKAIPYVLGDLCAATALRGWISAATIVSGAVFRPVTRHNIILNRHLSDHSVAEIVKTLASKAGLKSSEFSGHSLRAGHVTQARRNGVPDAETMALTGHKRIETLNMYDRRNNPFSKTSAGSVLGGMKK